jgi:hypothetical protein
MVVCYSLTLDDHLAWYDYFLGTPAGSRSRSALPIIGSWFSQRRRQRYARQILATSASLGDRSLELSADGVREFSDLFDFATRWQDISLVATKGQHLFIAHTSMNAHIVPLSVFASPTDRDAFTSFAQSHAATPNI